MVLLSNEMKTLQYSWTYLPRPVSGTITEGETALHMGDDDIDIYQSGNQRSMQTSTIETMRNQSQVSKTTLYQAIARTMFILEQSG